VWPGVPSARKQGCRGRCAGAGGAPGRGRCAAGDGEGSRGMRCAYEYMYIYIDR